MKKFVISGSGICRARRFLAFLLAFCLTASLLPGRASARLSFDSYLEVSSNIDIPYGEKSGELSFKLNHIDLQNTDMEKIQSDENGVVYRSPKVIFADSYFVENELHEPYRYGLDLTLYNYGKTLASCKTPLSEIHISYVTQGKSVELPVPKEPGAKEVYHKTDADDWLYKDITVAWDENLGSIRIIVDLDIEGEDNSGNTIRCELIFAKGGSDDLRYSLTAPDDIENGTVIHEPFRDTTEIEGTPGSIYNVTVTPDDKYRYAGYTVNNGNERFMPEGSVSGTTFQLTITEDTTLHHVFERVTQ